MTGSLLKVTALRAALGRVIAWSTWASAAWTSAPSWVGFAISCSAKVWSAGVFDRGMANCEAPISKVLLRAALFRK